MELKKKPEANLEKRRGLFLVSGYIVALALVLVAFEWKTYEKTVASLGQLEMEDIEQEEIPITEQEVTPPPPPPPPPAPEIEIVEDDTEIEEEVEIMDVEAEMETAIEIFEAPIEEEEEEEAPEIFQIVEQMPKYPGGDAELYKYINSQIKYPEIARENGLEDRITIRFVVDEKGNVSQVTVVRGKYDILNTEAERVVKMLKGFEPGRQRGKPVKVWYTLPVLFKLN